uniref:IS66 family transposase n=1 Tax=Rhizobium laguerreae TaxID=1076926 RepID=UPI0028C42FAB|nr:transposase [Rhizobium laguerreae]
MESGSTGYLFLGIMYYSLQRPRQSHYCPCWAHARRKLVEIIRTGSTSIAEEGVKRIGELYRIEGELHGFSSEASLAGRQERSAPLIADMRSWLAHHRTRVAGKSPLGEALAYVAKYWDGLCVFLTDGRIEIDNNVVERTIRPIAGPESLCTPSLSICKDWKRLRVSNATRAALQGYRGLDRRRSQVADPDLIRRTANHLFGGQHLHLYQMAYSMVSYA